MSRSLGVHEARVEYTRSPREGIQRCEVRIFRREETSLALNYPRLTGTVRRGDEVLVNTTAMDLQLGSGGFHVVVWGPRMSGHLTSGAGHILKLRYTPWQMRVMAIEEEDSPHHDELATARNLQGMPVLCLELHSQLLPAVAGIRAADASLSVALVMTDGGALPLVLSDVVHLLRDKAWINHTLTAGHSFGGQWEAVNEYSGLLAARWALNADVAVTCIGPGAVGTGTPFGHTGLQQAQCLNAAGSLEGIRIMPPRFSSTDPRERHRGLSHHTQTVLRHAVGEGVRIVLAEDGSRLLHRAMTAAGAADGHRVVGAEGAPGMSLVEQELAPPQRQQLLRFMGRSPDRERDFFLTASAAGRFAAQLASGEGDR